MNFRSVAQLSDRVLAWSKRLPRDIDAVVGIPRSGLLVANLLAVYRNVPLADVEGLLEGRCLTTGGTKIGSLVSEDVSSFLDTPRNLLVVDDSIGSGGTMARTRERLASSGLAHRIRYGVVYAAPDMVGAVDFHAETLHFPRMFEWNVLQSLALRTACVDIDGVLCHDPSGRENDDGERYLEFLRTSPPLLRPQITIGWLVTSRLEKYRPETEAWLDAHNVRYNHLVMLEYPDQDTRMRMHTHAAHKAQVYRDSGAELFIESNVRQAVEIATLAGKDVLCIDTMQMVTPGALPVARPAASLTDAQMPSLPRRLVAQYVPEPTKQVLRDVRRRLKN